MTLKQRGWLFGVGGKKEKKPPPPPDPEGLMPHQRRVVDRLKNVSGLVVMHGLGSGKTRTAYAAHKSMGGSVDVIAPAALHEHWKNEGAKWKTDPKKVKLHSEQKIARSGFTATSPLLIVDEGHRARNARSKFAGELRSAPGQKRLLLTGTPVYNRAADIASVVNQAAGKEVLPEGAAFDRKYLRPGRGTRWLGGTLSNKHELGEKLHKFVDFHGDRGDQPPVHEKTVHVPMKEHQSALYHAAIGKIPPGIRRIMFQRDIDEKSLARLRPYLTGPRLVSNSTAAVGSKRVEEPKIDKAFSDLQEHLKKPEGKALVYSNWLKGGINQMHDRLQKAHIPHAVFTGEETKAQRAEGVQDYNAGRKRVLVVSSAGGEGLDLKGTRMVQVLEPHFNKSKIQQVIGRASRIGSHTHLTKEQHRVDVVHYVARPKRRIFGGVQSGVDDWLTDLSAQKDKVHRELTELIAKRQHDKGSK